MGGGLSEIQIYVERLCKKYASVIYIVYVDTYCLLWSVMPFHKPVQVMLEPLDATKCR